MADTKPQPESSPKSAQVSKRLQRMTTRSTCTKFLVRIIPPLLAAALIFMVVFGYTMQQKIRTEIHTDVEAYATSLSYVLDDLMWNFQTEELQSALATISSNPAMVGAEIYDTRGSLFITYGDTDFAKDSNKFFVQRPIFKARRTGESEPLGRFVLYYNFDHADKQFLEYFMGEIFRLVIIVMVIAISFFFSFQQVIGRPLRTLLKAIHATDSSDKWVQAKWEGNDEISAVIHAHNKMIGHIAAKEGALAESEQRYRQLFDNALVGIYHMRPDGTVKDANKTIADIMGYPSVEELRGVNVIGHYVDKDERTRLWKDLEENGVISHFRTQFTRVDGSIMWGEMSGRINPDGTFNGILQDVTTQVEALQALEERDELHRAFFEENKAVMLLHDPLTSSIQFVNPAACFYYGYTEEELRGMTIRELDCMTDDEMYEELKQAASERRSYFKHVHTLRDGSKRNVEVFTGPVSIGKRQLHYSIIHDVTDKRRLEARLERMATRDQLTGAYNRHAFFETAKAEIIRTRRFGHPMAILMFDLDHFKKVNDTHGHSVGDEVLRNFALRCRADLRQSDIFARLGGEEFAALLVETDEERSMEVAERIRKFSEAKPIITEAGELIVTTSIGVASLQEDESVNQILKRADKGLYMAKEAGRNTIRKA